MLHVSKDIAEIGRRGQFAEMLIEVIVELRHHCLRKEVVRHITDLRNMTLDIVEIDHLVVESAIVIGESWSLISSDHHTRGVAPSV